MFAYQVWSDFGGGYPSCQAVFEQHMRARGVLQHSQSLGPRYEINPSRVRKADIKRLGMPRRCPSASGYSLGNEFRESQQRISRFHRGNQQSAWHMLTRPQVLHCWLDCEDLCSDYMHGIQDDGLFWIGSIDIKTWDFGLLKDICDDDRWDRLTCSLCLWRSTDGKMIQLAVDAPAFEEQPEEHITDFYMAFNLGPATVRLEVTLDATAVAKGYWDAEVNVGIDPREPDPAYFHLVNDFDEMLRLVESEAAQCLWV